MTNQASECGDLIERIMRDISITFPVSEQAASEPGMLRDEALKQLGVGKVS